jgi:hypothetical protein
MHRNHQFDVLECAVKRKRTTGKKGHRTSHKHTLRERHINQTNKHETVRNDIDGMTRIQRSLDKVYDNATRYLYKYISDTQEVNTECFSEESSCGTRPMRLVFCLSSFSFDTVWYRL